MSNPDRVLARWLGVKDGKPVYGFGCQGQASGSGAGSGAGGRRVLARYLGVKDGRPLFGYSTCEFPRIGRYLMRFVGMTSDAEPLPLYALGCCPVESSSGSLGSSGSSGSSGSGSSGSGSSGSGSSGSGSSGSGSSGSGSSGSGTTGSGSSGSGASGSGSFGSESSGSGIVESGSSGGDPPDNHAPCDGVPTTLFATTTPNCNPGVPSPHPMSKSGSSWSGGATTTCAPTGWTVTVTCVDDSWTWQVQDGGGTYSGDLEIVSASPFHGRFTYTPTGTSCCSGTTQTVNVTESI